jgi:sugar O-acyltransferase (sialic acid O-acetyltransferase NeuD family)
MLSCDLPFIVIGAGGHARPVGELLSRLGATVLGHTGLETVTPSNYRQLRPYLGTEEILASHGPEMVVLANGLGSTGADERRAAIFERLAKLGYRFPPLVHPTAIVAGDVILGEGTQLMAGAILQPATTIGRNVLVNTGVIIDHDCTVGDHSHLAPGVVVSGLVRIGRNVFIGAGATVKDFVAIDDACLVDAGAVVAADLKSVRE